MAGDGTEADRPVEAQHACPIPGFRAADCWIVALAGIPEPLEALLPAEEQARAARFRQKCDGHRFAASHAALRLILARYLDQPPASLVFAAGENGRPFLTGGGKDLHFNLSHSGDVALVAVASAPVGVDVERIKEMADFAKIARRHFAPVELESVLQTAAEEQPRAFHAIWTRKEAFVKATGLGLRFPLTDFSTGGAAEAPFLMMKGQPCPDWTIMDLKPGEGYVGALAVAWPDAAVRCLQPDWPSLLDRLSPLR